MPLMAKMEKPGGANIRRQVLRGALLVLVLVPTLVIWTAVGTVFFGYRPVSAWGNSMEPVLQNGDAFWVKRLDITEVKVGDIVTLALSGEESITHRVVKVESLSNGGYLLVIKGDANQFTEEWELRSDGTVEVLAARVPFAGYILEFIASILGRVLIISALVSLIVIWIRQRHIAREESRPALTD